MRSRIQSKGISAPMALQCWQDSIIRSASRRVAASKRMTFRRLLGKTAEAAILSREMVKLIFDTSAINKLAADPDCSAILAGLCIAYHIGITGTVLSEVVANSDDRKRGQLLDLLKRLLACGK